VKEKETRDEIEKEIARSAATRMFIDTKCNRRTAISFVSQTPALVQPREAKDEGGGREREKEKSRKGMIENHL